MAPITLAEAKNNTTDAIDVAVIDEFRKGALVDTLIFDTAVNPSGGGDTLTYGYRRLTTQATAATRELNTEYTEQNVETKRYTTDLAVLGGAFTVDRVIARLGPAASASVELNMQQKIKATNAKLAELVLYGDKAVDANGFDGLDKALTGSSTEFNVGAVSDWSNLDASQYVAHGILDKLDEFLSLLDGTPTVIVGNQKALAKVRAVVRRTGMYVRNPIDGLVGANGRPIEREEYGGITLIDAGDKAGSSLPIIPVESRTIGGTQATGLTDIFVYRVGLDGFHGVTTTDGRMVSTFLPDFTTPNAVKKGEVELGPIAVALKATKAAAVFRNIKVQ